MKRYICLLVVLATCRHIILAEEPIAIEFDYPVRPFTAYKNDAPLLEPVWFNCIDTDQDGLECWDIGGAPDSHDGDSVQTCTAADPDRNCHRLLYHLGEDWNRGSGDEDCGDPVYSIADGRVVYAGPGLLGFGNVIIIKHVLDGGREVGSLYAHLQETSVSTGEPVHLETEIGTIGKTGGWPFCHLHFEMRSAPDMVNCTGPFTSDRCTGRGWTDSVGGGLYPSKEKQIDVDTISGYLVPSAFLDERLLRHEQVLEHSVFGGDFFSAPSWVAGRNAVLSGQGGDTSMIELLENEEVNVVHLFPPFTWADPDDLVFEVGEAYWIKSDPSYHTLRVYLPTLLTNGFDDQAVSDVLVHLGSQFCREDSQRGCFVDLLMTSFTHVPSLSDDNWSVHRVSVRFREADGDEATDTIYHARSLSNPVWRLITYPSPVNGDRTGMEQLSINTGLLEN